MEIIQVLYHFRIGVQILSLATTGIGNQIRIISLTVLPLRSINWSISAIFNQNLDLAIFLSKKGFSDQIWLKIKIFWTFQIEGFYVSEPQVAQESDLAGL